MVSVCNGECMWRHASEVMSPRQGPNMYLDLIQQKVRGCRENARAPWCLESRESSA